MASPLAILTIDRSGAVQFVNPAGLTLFARDEVALVGAMLTELAHPLDRSALQQMLSAAAAGDRPERQEVRFRRPQQEEVTTGFSVAPTEDRSFAVCVLRDLSGEKAVLPQLLHTTRMASMGLMASVVAHELNNSLTGAIGCLELLAKASRSEQPELISTALSELHRSAQIVGDIKGFARKREEMDSQVDLLALVESARRLTRYNSAGVEQRPLEIELPTTLPTIRGNKNQLLQALLNMIRNAEDAVGALPTERRAITIRAHHERDVVHIAIVDRGPGVPPKLREKLFEPFYSTKPTVEGTGLGLTVVQSVASGHSGRVALEETPGGGATFVLTLPVHVEGTTPAATNGAASEAASLSLLHGRRLLIADDEAAIRKVFERVAERNGAEVTVCADATSAIQHLKEGAFDLLFLDVRMPGGGGPAVFEFLEAHRPQLARRTIFISGELSTDMQAIVGRGYARLLKKPFSMSLLAEAAREALVGDPASS